MSEDDSVLTRAAPPPSLRIAYGSQADQYALVWQGTSASAASQPLIVLLHGGFWRPKYDLGHMSSMAAALAATGLTVANVEYRRIPGDPESMISDLRLALTTLPSKIAAHNGRILLVGFSAGGHLALLLAATSALGNAVLALAPIACLDRARQLRLSDDAASEFVGVSTDRWQRWCPAAMPSCNVPVSIVHAEDDETVPVELSRRYVERHPQAQLMTLPHAGHFALIDPESRAWPAVLTAVRQSAAAAMA